MSPILHHLQTDELPLDVEEERRIKKQVVRYTLHSRNLYKMGRASTMLWFLGKHESSLVLVEVHKGPYINQIGGKSLAHKLLRILLA